MTRTREIHEAAIKALPDKDAQVKGACTWGVHMAHTNTPTHVLRPPNQERGKDNTRKVVVMGMNTRSQLRALSSSPAKKNIIN